MDMIDVRRALWGAYKKAQKTEYGIEGKSSEAWCELQYPPFWDADDEETFIRPHRIMIFSYALGSSRRHYIEYGPEDKQVDYYIWQSPDIFKKAVEVIESWAAEIDDWDSDS